MAAKTRPNDSAGNQALVNTGIYILVAGALAAGCIVGVAATFPLVRQAQSFIAWIYTPWWLPLLLTPPSLLMCCAAAIMSVRAALNVDPARVFRA